jgi:hypothetical protein
MFQHVGVSWLSNHVPCTQSSRFSHVIHAQSCLRFRTVQIVVAIHSEGAKSKCKVLFQDGQNSCWNFPVDICISKFNLTAFRKQNAKSITGHKSNKTHFTVAFIYTSNTLNYTVFNTTLSFFLFCLFYDMFWPHWAIIRCIADRAVSL